MLLSYPEKYLVIITFSILGIDNRPGCDVPRWSTSVYYGQAQIPHWEWNGWTGMVNVWFYIWVMRTGHFEITKKVFYVEKDFIKSLVMFI